MKLVIDQFDTQEQCVAFIDWIKRRSDLDQIRLITIDGPKSVVFDGVDLGSSTKDSMTINIVVDSIEQEED